MPTTLSTIPLNAPGLNKISFNGSVIQASWTPTPDSGNYFLITLFEDGQSLTSARATGASGMILGVSVDLTKMYVIQVAQTDSSYTQVGDYSNAIAVIVAAPSQIQMEYDGENLTLQWLAPAGLTTAQGAMVSLFEKSQSQLLFSHEYQGTSALFTPDLPLDFSKDYVVTVAGLNPGSTGPASAPLDVVQKTLQLSEVLYNTTAITATADQSVLTPSVPMLYLYADGDSVGNGVSGSGNQVIFPVQKALNPWQSYQVRIAWVNPDGSRGPLSKPMVVVTGAPVLDSLDYDGSQIQAAWHNPQQTPAPTGASILLFQGEALINNVNVVGNSGVLALSQPLDAGTAYTLCIAATYGPSTGPNGNGMPVISAGKSMSQVLYDGQKILASWPSGNPAGATGYRLVLQCSGFTVKEQAAGGTGGAMDSLLDPETAYQLTLLPVAPGVVGMASPALSVIPAIPAVKQVTVASGHVSVDVDDSATTGKNGITGYAAALYCGNSLVQGPVAASGTPLRADFPVTLDAESRYSVRVQAVGNNSVGPWSASETALAGILEIGQVDFDGTRALVSWTPLKNPDVTGYTVLLQDTAAGTTQSFATPFSSLSIPVDATRDFTIQVQAVGNRSVGTPSVAVAVLRETLALTQVAYDGEFLSATWNAASLTGADYELVLLDETDVVSSFSVSTNQAKVPVILAEDVAYSLQVRAIHDQASGPLGAAFSVISSSPRVQSVTTDSNQVTVVLDETACNGKPGVTSYQAVLFQGNEQLGDPVTAAGSPLTAVFAEILKPQLRYSVQARAMGAGISGPLCKAAAALSAAPVITDVHYNGSAVTVSWSPVTEPVAAYELTLIPAEDPLQAIAVNTVQTSGSILLDAATASGTYSVAVRALLNDSIGPISLAVDAIGNGFHLSTAAGLAPAVLPDNNSLPEAAFSIDCDLPELYSTPPATLPSSGAFVLSQITASQNGFRYRISFAPDSAVWSFDTSLIRTTLQAQYQTFLLMLEGKAPGQDPSTQGTLLAGSVQIVIAALARVLPQTFPETLFYSAGLSSASNYSDLRPGMKLRVEYGQWQSEGSSAPSYVNGYVGNGVAEYEIGSYQDSSGNLRTGFNAFLAGLDGLTVLDPRGSGTGPYDGGAGVIDFFSQTFRQPFYRLFYPSVFKVPSDPGSGYAVNNAMILAAADWATLSTLTDTIVQGSGSTIPAVGSNYVLAYLRGRAILTPLIGILVNGELTWVPVGTTLGQVLEQFATKPMPISASIRGLRYQRVGSDPFSNRTAATPTFTAGKTQPIRFGWGSSLTYANGSNWFCLPVLSGDRISFLRENV
ncbi:MAG TPA: hypothetical protein VLM37_05580 [Fibrobacteraceae bacterium]|nr:hypothetical protein [Fibrobacteraceae bacterium]